MNVFFIYANIPREAYDKTLKFLLSHQYDFRSKDGMMRGLYAITNNKKYMKEFFDLRGGNEIYTVVKKEVDKEEWKEIITDRYSDLILKKSKYQSDDESHIELIVTSNEETTTKYDGEAYLSEFGPRQYADVDYMLFNNTIINALDFLGYTTFFDMSSHSLDPSRREAASYNMDFRQTVYGHDLPDFTNDMNILLFLYRVMFVGYQKKEGE